MAIVGLKIRASVISTIYRKTLTVRSTVLHSEFSVGEIVNFMSTDTDRIVNSCPSFHALWSTPLYVRCMEKTLKRRLLTLAFLTGRRNAVFAVYTTWVGVPSRNCVFGVAYTGQQIHSE